ncbi:MAG: glycosyltransferase [Hyphomonas sp.]|nr:glycosyltransferase [Hyphomonas sp.]
MITPKLNIEEKFITVGNNKPLISIIVPTFNSEVFISDMMESLSAQTSRDFELIISDGKSSDKTIEIVRSYELPYLSIDCRPDKGVWDALNRGFSLARGDVLCWLNSDDFYVRDDVVEIVARAFAEPAVEFAYGHTYIVDREGYITRELFAHVPSFGLRDRGNNLITGSMFFRANLWRSFGGFSGKYKYAFEYEIKRHLSANISKPTLIDSFISSFRRHGDGITDRYADVIKSEAAEIFGSRDVVAKTVVKAERYYSLFVQGNFLGALRSSFPALNKSEHWSSRFHTEQASERR